MSETVDPVPNGYGSNIQDPVIEDAGTYDWWEAQYTAFLEHLNHLCEQGDAQLAYEELPYLMNISQNYTTNGLNVEVADKSNFDSTIGQYLNAIQEDFDQYSQGTKVGTTTAIASDDYAKDALYDEQQINRLMAEYPTYAAPIQDVQNQLDVIIPEQYENDPQGLADYWASLWNLPDPSNDPSSSGYQGTSPVSNGINAARNDVESQNTILNSQMQTYSKEASQDLSIEQDCFKSNIDTTKTAVTAMQSAGS
ncbi:MAG: hypothetical protein H7A41_03705 [Chlamydiales bacterium]|nr:hypothetical protein [Chlamydiia bacterium]MCP5504241.1 hypothetical protein [Chlamydiales bacterium]